MRVWSKKMWGLVVLVLLVLIPVVSVHNSVGASSTLSMRVNHGGPCNVHSRGRHRGRVCTTPTPTVTPTGTVTGTPTALVGGGAMETVTPTGTMSPTVTTTPVTTTTPIATSTPTRRRTCTLVTDVTLRDSNGVILLHRHTERRVHCPTRHKHSHTGGEY